MSIKHTGNEAHASYMIVADILICITFQKRFKIGIFAKFVCSAVQLYSKVRPTEINKMSTLPSTLNACFELCLVYGCIDNTL